MEKKTMKTKTVSSKKHLSAVTYRKAKGFSRLEACVIILILQFSVCIIIAASETLEADAKAVLCQSHLGLLSRALFDYTADYDGYIMPANLMTDKQGKTLPYYHNFNPMFWTAEMEYWYVNLWAKKYAADANTFFCPDFFPFDFEGHEAFAKLAEANGQPHVHFNKTSGEALILGMRDWSYATGDTVFRGPKRVSKIPQPSRFFLVADSVNMNHKNMAMRFPKPSQTFRIMALERADQLSHQEGVHLRHQSRASAVFADGHVARRSANHFLAIRNPKNWQHEYSKAGRDNPPAKTGCRVYDNKNNITELVPTSSTPVDAD